MAGSPFDCPICLGTYNDSARFPHGLACGHCLCRTCLQQLLKAPADTRACPLCKQGVEAETVADVPCVFQLVPGCGPGAAPVLASEVGRPYVGRGFRVKGFRPTG